MIDFFFPSNHKPQNCRTLCDFIVYNKLPRLALEWNKPNNQKTKQNWPIYEHYEESSKCDLLLCRQPKIVWELRHAWLLCIHTHTRAYTYTEYTNTFTFSLCTKCIPLGPITSIICGGNCFLHPWRSFHDNIAAGMKNRRSSENLVKIAFGILFKLLLLLYAMKQWWM